MIPKATTLVFLGRSGSGKDTQIDFLLRREELKEAVRTSTGDGFREFAARNTPLGRKAKEILDKGERQPDWFAFTMWFSSFGALVQEEEIVLSSGSPRSLREAGLIDEVLEFIGRPKAVAVYLNIASEEVEKRLLSRGRHDDNKTEILRKMGWFETDVLPAVDYYRRKQRLIEVNGEQSPEEVFKELEEKLGTYFAK
mgnify:CR=1 FL=1